MAWRDNRPQTQIGKSKIQNQECVMASEDYEEPFGWWGWHWQPPVPLSVIQLIEARSFDVKLMALLWSLLARRASIIVGAEPPMAGKTTTLTALIDFLPP